MPASLRPRPWRGVFLRTLSETANVSEAARTAGVQWSTAYSYRRRNGLFARDWMRALEDGRKALAARERLIEIDDHGPAARVLSRAGPGRGLKLIRPGEGRWTPEREARFFEELMRTANLSASAEAVGISARAIHSRRSLFPAFDAAVRETCVIAAERFNLLLIHAGSNTLAPPAIAHDIDTPLVSVNQAIRIVQMNLPERRYRGR